MSILVKIEKLVSKVVVIRAKMAHLGAMNANLTSKTSVLVASFALVVVII